MLNNKGKTVLVGTLLIAVVLLFSFMIIPNLTRSGELLPGEYNYLDWKYHNESNLSVNAIAYYSCDWGNPSDVNKTCTPIIEIKNTGTEPVKIDTLSVTQDFSALSSQNCVNIVDSVLVNQTLINWSCVNYTAEMYEANCTVNVSRISWDDGDYLCSDSPSETISPGNTMAIKLNWEMNKYQGGSYNFSFKENRTNLTITLDPTINACGNLTLPNSVYTLIQNISSTGDCIYIQASNITLDCQQIYSINTTNGVGVSIQGGSSGINNTIIKNCNIYGTSPTIGAYCDSIFVVGSLNNITIFNNNLNPNCCLGYGIDMRYFTGINGQNISNNRIIVGNGPSSPDNSLGYSGYVDNLGSKIINNHITLMNGNVQGGIEVYGQDGVTIKNNLIDGDTIGGVGISSGGHCDNVLIYNNTINFSSTTRWTGAIGIGGQGYNNGFNITQNNFTNAGIGLSGGENHSITLNEVKVLNPYTSNNFYGISLSGNFSNLLVQSNKINSTSVGIYGNQAYGPDYLKILGNNITSNGIYFISSYKLNFSSNLPANLQNVNLTNVTDFYFSPLTSWTLHRKWYVDVLVNSTNGPLPNINVTIQNVNNQLIYSQLSNSTGQITRQETRQYYQNTTNTYYDTNLTFNASKYSTVYDSEKINLTANKVMNDGTEVILFIGDSSFPQFIFNSPTPNDGQVINYTTITINVTCTDADTVCENVTLNWNGTLETQNYTGSNTFIFIKNDLLNNIYSYNITAVDIAGNLNTTTTRTVNVLADYNTIKLYPTTYVDMKGTGYSCSIFTCYNHNYQNRWNLSSLPQNLGVVNATYCAYWKDKKGSPDNDNHLWRVDDQTWNGTTLTPTDWNNQGVTNSTFDAWNSTTNATYSCTNVSKMVIFDDVSNNDYTSLRYEDVDYSMGNADATSAQQILGRSQSGGTSQAVYYEDDPTKDYLYITFRAIVAPQITFVSPTPGNDTWRKYNWVTFNITTNLNSDLCNLTWQGVNTTMTKVSPTNFYSNITSINPDGTYTYNVTCNSSDSGLWGLSATQTVKIDTTIPLIQFVAITPDDGSGTPNTWAYINATYTETNVGKCILNWNGTNQTITPSGGLCGTNKTGLNGMYTFKMYINDSTGNYNSTELRTIYTNVQSPILTYVSPTPLNDTWKTINFVTINTTVSYPGMTLDKCIIDWNGANVSIFSPTGNVCVYNKTGIIDGTYTYRMYANNTLGFLGAEVRRTVKIDTLYPQLASITPANNTYLNSSVGYITMVITEANLNSRAVDFGKTTRSNYTLSCPGSSPYNCYVTIPYSLDDTNSTSYYTYWLWATDFAGQFNSTKFYNLYVDTVNPIINFTSPTPTNNYFSASNFLTVNVSLDDLEVNFANYTFNLYYQNGTSRNTTTQVSSLINWTGLSEGKYYYNVTATDKANNKGYTSTRTWTYDNTNPLISYVSPPTILNDNSSSRTILIEVNYTEANPYQFFLNFTSTSGSPNYNTYVYGMPSGTNIYDIYIYSVVYGNYTFYVNFTDTSGHSTVTSTNWVFENATTPIVTLVSPVNPTYSKITSVNFTCSAILSPGGPPSFSTLTNLTLYINGTANQTVNYTSEGVNMTFNKTMAENYYVWNCEACDSDDVCSQYGVNYSLYVDTTNPGIEYSGNSDTSGTFIRDWILVNFSISDNLAGVDNVIAKWGNVNYSKYNGLTCDSSYCYKNFTGLSDASFNVRGFINDSAGNENSTGTRAFLIDSIGPSISITTPDEGYTYTTNILSLSISPIYSITDNVALDTCYYNVTDQAGNLVKIDTNILCNSTTTNFSINSAGSYYINMFANTSNHETTYPRFFIVSYSTTPGPGGPGENETKLYCGDGICSPENNENWENCQIDCVQGTSLSKFISANWLWISLLIIIFIILFIILRKKKRR